MDLQAIIEKTRKALGDEADLSYITANEMEKADKLKKILVNKGNKVFYSNSLLQYPDGHWEWYDNCITLERYKAVVKVTSKRLPNCTTGLIHYEIKT